MKKMIFGIALAAIMALASCEQADHERYFRATPMDGGASVRIVEYLGDRWAVNIPSRIQGLPVTHIGSHAFSNSSLTSVTIPNSVVTIESGAFRNNQLASVTIPNSVAYIGSYAFADNSLTSVTIRRGVTHIGNGAFENNYLTSVAITDSVTSIGQRAFWDNELASATVPANTRLLNVYSQGWGGLTATGPFERNPGVAVTRR